MKLPGKKIEIKFEGIIFSVVEFFRCDKSNIMKLYLH